MKSHTLKEPVTLSGIGLHTGVKTSITLKPSPLNSGILFNRTDKSAIIPARWSNVVSTKFSTNISSNNAEVKTVEHLLSALSGLHINNCEILIDNIEVPILDGSAKEWIEILLKSGISTSNAPIKIIKINKNVKVDLGDKFIEIKKSKVSLDIDFEIKYPGCIIGNQRNKFNILNDDLSYIYESRTFCKYEDIDNLKKLGFAKGGSLDNAIVVKKNEILNKNGLRNDKEFVNHKILDCMGDLYLSGYKIIGSIVCSQGGHSLTHKLLCEIFADKSNFNIIELKGKNLPHTIVDYYHLKSIA